MSNVKTVYFGEPVANPSRFDTGVVVDVSSHRAMNHWIFGNAAIFLGDGVCGTISENIKTAIQLKAVDMAEGFPVDRVHMQPVTNGIYTNFWKSIFLLGCRWIGNFNVDMKLVRNNIALPWPLQGAPGIILGTLLTYPLDLVRTRQGEATFSPLADRKKRKVSVLKIYDDFGFSALWKGVELGLLYNVAQHIISKTMEAHVFHPAYFSAISPENMKPQVASFIALAVAKILLNPIEIAKKRAQQEKVVVEATASGVTLKEQSMIDTLTTIYREEGIAGLFSGWYMAIPEAFSTVIVTHVAYAAIKCFIRKYYESK